MRWLRFLRRAKVIGRTSKCAHQVRLPSRAEASPEGCLGSRHDSHLRAFDIAAPVP